ncbi:hypothetical protein C8R44DRAFT_383791 [Mycena epipterygia]|nr:hypothetical protein C8R44DRAFT_383791 [Mycena epipterygia]
MPSVVRQAFTTPRKSKAQVQWPLHVHTYLHCRRRARRASNPQQKPIRNFGSRHPLNGVRVDGAIRLPRRGGWRRTAPLVVGPSASALQNPRRRRGYQGSCSGMTCQADGLLDRRQGLARLKDRLSYIRCGGPRRCMSEDIKG